MLCCRDVCSLPPPAGSSHAALIAAVRAFVLRHGQQLESFVACAVSGTLPSAVQQQIRDAGVQLEEDRSSKPQSRSCDVFVLTRLLAIALCAAGSVDVLHRSQPSLLLLSDDSDLCPALSLLGKSSLFREVRLVHSGGLTAHCQTPSVSLSQLLQSHPLLAPAPFSYLPGGWREQTEKNGWQSTRRPAARCSIPGGITPPSSATSTPTSCASYRSLSTSPSSTTSSGSSLSPPIASECVQAFESIVQCCKREKIIPRESVLRKKLLDDRYALGLDFEEFLHAVIEIGVGVIEGCSPQRVVWPREGQTARRFAWYVTHRHTISPHTANTTIAPLMLPSAKLLTDTCPACYV